MIILGITLTLAALILLASFICYRIVFYAKPRPPLPPGEYDIPTGKDYDPHYETMKTWQQQVREMEHRSFTIRSHDGLKLWANYYEYAPGATVELMFHGYRGSAQRDLCGGVQRAFALGHSVLLVDQRASRGREGRTITFGVKEHRDCLAWVDFAVSQFGIDTKIILTGISMGAATVLMAAGKPLPPNVVGVLADCGYTSARDIIQKCTRDLRLPPKLLYPFIRLGAAIFGGFALEEYSPIQAMSSCRVPVIFFHGDGDTFVPCEMSRQNYDACVSPKKLVIVPGAGHGLSYLLDPEQYRKEIADFFTENGAETTTKA